MFAYSGVRARHRANGRLDSCQAPDEDSGRSCSRRASLRAKRVERARRVFAGRSVAAATRGQPVTSPARYRTQATISCASAALLMPR